MKFKDFSRTFQNLFEQIQGPSVPNITYYFKKLYYSVYLFSNELYKICFWGKIKPKFWFSDIVPWKVLCPPMANSSFWLFFAVKGEHYLPIPGFKGPQPKFKDCLTRACNFLLPVPGLSRIFKDHGDPEF